MASEFSEEDRAAFAGKTVASIEVYDECGLIQITIHFTIGSSFIIHPTCYGGEAKLDVVATIVETADDF